MELTLNEASLIVDAMNGVKMIRDERAYYSDAPKRHHLMMNVRCAMRIDKLDKKWNVKAKDVRNKLASLNEEDASVLLDKIALFWSNSPHWDMEVGLKHAGIIT